MRIVIVGGTGNIGTALVRRLAGDHDVRVVARRVPAATEQVAPGVEWIRADIAADDLAPAVAGADTVVHLAWRFQPTRDPDRTWRTNAIGSRRLLAAVEAARTPALIYVSSVAAYSPRVDRRPVDEDYPTHGSAASAYAREKAYVERLLDAFELRVPRTRTVRIRPAFAFQREAAAEQWRLFVAHPRLRRLFDTRLLPVVPLPDDLVMQAVHASDVSEALAAAIEREVSGAYNIAAHDVLEPSDVASLLDVRPLRIPSRWIRPLMAAAWNVRASKAPPDLYDTLLNLPVMSTRRARQDLGWHPSTTAADAVGAFLTGTKCRESGPAPPLHEREEPLDPPVPPTGDQQVDPGASKAELYELAKKAGIEGRSTMTKTELVSALRRAGPVR